jgi:hypothetical protein
MRRSIVAVLLFSLGLIGLSNQVLAAPAEMKEWTMLVFLNGHNNLDSFGALNINQMEQVGSSQDINVLVQWASERSHPNATKRLYIKKDSDTNKVSSPIVQELGKVDMGDYRSIVDFVSWAVANYPAKHYFIDVWDHGSGWHRTQLNRAQGGAGIMPMDISFDDATGNHITTAQLGMAMAESAKAIGHNVDLYASDACLMSMVEVAQEMAGHVDVYAGSEEVEPGAGWPYAAFLKRWTDSPKIEATEVGKVLADEYVKSYTGGSWQVNFSAFDMSKIGAVTASVKALGAQLQTLDKTARQKAMGAASKAVSFEYSDYVDLGDFVNELEGTRTLDSGLIAGVRNATQEFVIANRFTSKFAKAKGAAIWIPTSQYSLKAYSDRYKALQFDSLTGWGTTLAYLLQDGTSSDDGDGWPAPALR